MQLMRSRDTEKTIRELQQFLREHEDEITDEDSMHRLAITFMSQHNSRLQPKQTEPEDASDYLELASYRTRPYMRVCYTYFQTLIECGMMRCAINEGERLLKLSEGDSLGVRYQLMHLYAYTEDEMHALALHKKYGGYEETQMLLPLAILYYKQNQFDKAKDYLNRLAKVNRDTKKFMRLEAKHDGYSLRMERGMHGYRPGTIEELVDAYLNSTYLFNATPYFIQ